MAAPFNREAEEMSVGRYWGSAHSAALTEFGDGCALIKLTWADGATLHLSHDTHADARDELRSLGFCADAATPLAS